MTNRSNYQSIQQIISQSDKEVELKIDNSKVHLTHLEKILWPKHRRDAQAGPLRYRLETTCQVVSSKRDLILYWLDHWLKVEDQLKDRPITAVRCIEGVVKDCFYQRHFDEKLPAFIQTVDIWTEDKESDQRYLMINNLATLLWLVNREIIEIHTWLSKATDKRQVKPRRSKENLEKSDLNYPDLILFDLDPHIRSTKKINC